MSQSMKSLLMRTGLMSAVIGVASPAALAAVVEGKVTAGGAGVEGAVVEVVETGQSVSTDEAGAYRFGALPAGEYTLSVSYIGTEDKSSSIIATDETATTLNFALDDELRVLDSIIVTGQRGSMFAGINQQRAADNLISVISSDALGQFPDQNVAESVRRIAGISVANDQGEGRFVVIRGIDPALNATSVNGVRVPAPESGTRAVALDVIDSDILDSVEVIKSLTPDLDGDGIGGSINIKTLSAFDKDGLYVKAKADAIYSESSEETNPKVSLTASNTFMDGKLGVAGSVSYQEREFTTSNVESDGLTKDFLDDTGLYIPEELELRHYEITRQRLSTSLNFNYKLTDNTELYLRSLYNEFEDHEFRHRTEIKLEDTKELAVGSDGVIRFDIPEVDRDIKNRLETQKIWSTQFGGETFWDAYTLDYQVAYSHAEEKEPGRVDTDFRGETGEAATVDLFSVNVDYSDPKFPRYLGGSANINDRSVFEFDGLETTDATVETNDLAVKLDLKREGLVLGAPGFMKGGVKARFQDKNFDGEVNVYDFDGDDDYTLAQFDYEPDYGFGNFGPSANPGAAKTFFQNNFSDFELEELDSAVATFAERFKAFEDIYAGYFMAQADFGGALITGGARLEATNFTGKGYVVTLFEEDAGITPPGELVFGDAEEGVFLDYQTARQSYVDFLPSLNGRFDVTDTIVARAAYYASISRPSIKQATPSSEIERDDEGVYEGSIGNPDLDRQKANNVDFAIEWYPSRQGLLSVGAFFKEIKDPIAETVVKDYTAYGVTFDEAEISQNLEDGSLVGFEFNYQQSFQDILPGALDGLILGVNYTIIDSQTTFTFIDDQDQVKNRSIPLPNLSDETANVVVGYDKYGLDLRLALSYRSGYLDDIDASSDAIDRYYTARQQIDFTAKYDVTDNFTIVGEISNITDEEENAVFNTRIGSVLSQYDEFGYTAKFGLRYTY